MYSTECVKYVCIYVCGGVCVGVSLRSGQREEEEERQSDEGEEWLIRKKTKVHHQQENSQTVDYSVAAVFVSVCVCVIVCSGALGSPAQQSCLAVWLEKLPSKCNPFPDG